MKIKIDANRYLMKQSMIKECALTIREIFCFVTICATFN